MRQNIDIVTSPSLETDTRLNVVNKRPSINCRLAFFRWDLSDCGVILKRKQKVQRKRRTDILF